MKTIIKSTILLNENTGELTKSRVILHKYTPYELLNKVIMDTSLSIESIKIYSYLLKTYKRNPFTIVPLYIAQELQIPKCMIINSIEELIKHNYIYNTNAYYINTKFKQ